MSWSSTVNIGAMPAGSFRSIAGYASESLVVGRAMLCGYIIFIKAWRDSKYDAVLDANGNLFRIEIKGTSTGSDISTSSGGRSGEQISRKVKSRERPLSKIDCDWLIATTSMDSHCWVVPIELIEILGVKTIKLQHLERYKEKWSIFITNNPNINPYLKSGYRDLDEESIRSIARSFGIDETVATTPFSFVPMDRRVKRFNLSEKDRLIVAIWEAVFEGLR